MKEDHFSQHHLSIHFIEVRSYRLDSLRKGRSKLLHRLEFRRLIELRKRVIRMTVSNIKPIEIQIKEIKLARILAYHYAAGIMGTFNEKMIWKRIEINILELMPHPRGPAKPYHHLLYWPPTFSKQLYQPMWYIADCNHIISSTVASR